MRLKEQKLWDTFKRNCGKEFDLERVENLVSDGMPDVYSRETGAWIELKAPTVPKRATTPLLGDSEGLRVSQKNWALNATNRGRTVFVLIRDSEGELYLVPGKFAPSMNLMSRDQLREVSVANSWNSVSFELRNAR